MLQFLISASSSFGLTCLTKIYSIPRLGMCLSLIVVYDILQYLIRAPYLIYIFLVTKTPAFLFPSVNLQTFVLSNHVCVNYFNFVIFPFLTVTLLSIGLPGELSPFVSQ